MGIHNSHSTSQLITLIAVAIFISKSPISIDTKCVFLQILI